MIYRFTKRLFDIICSGIALIIVAPLFIFIVVGIKFSSKGDIFYKSKRVGYKGKQFVMYKFRSMHVKSEGVVENRYLVNTERIFPFGQFLRKSKLDELPQLINVFIGQMSFIGPRPYPQSVVNRLFVGEYEQILSVRPGLACLDSLFDYAHGDLFITDAEEYKNQIIPVRTELAQMYIERKSLILDTYCIVRTIILIFKIVFMKEKKFQLTKFEQDATKRVLEKLK